METTTHEVFLKCLLVLDEDDRVAPITADDIKNTIEAKQGDETDDIITSCRVAQISKTFIREGGSPHLPDVGAIFLLDVTLTWTCRKGSRESTVTRDAQWFVEGIFDSSACSVSNVFFI